MFDRKFQSTPSARRATRSVSVRRVIPKISIHALREEGDEIELSEEAENVIFQSTPSARRATKAASFSDWVIWLFQSTPSARRATACQTGGCAVRKDFNPRPPRGGRLVLYPPFLQVVNFNPRPPRGGRHFDSCRKVSALLFQSTPSARRATLRHVLPCFGWHDFNPRPPRGGRP